MQSPAERRKKILSAADAFRERQVEDAGGLRIVITGKGGVGKTTLTALLAHMHARDGRHVLAVDEDPQQNLAYSLGYPRDQAKKLVPLAENVAYIEEKTGARPGVGWGQMLTLNPNVSDVVDRFGVPITDRVSVLVMGSVIQAATGCLCPENALLESVIRSVRLRRGEVILLDTQAGVEHFGRALAEGFGQTIVVAEPGFNAMQVALHAAFLARQLGIPVIHLVVNKVRSGADRKKVGEMLADDSPFSSVIYLPFAEQVLETEPDVTRLLAGSSPFMDGVRELYARIRQCGLPTDQNR
ncbi:MAG: carbon monoxide dehydrogenase [Methanoculleus sp. SDB]|nr:MAG: carbon monoxide dehydrogenase [Methanoculleus sp. SDB]